MGQNNEMIVYNKTHRERERRFLCCCLGKVLLEVGCEKVCKIFCIKYNKRKIIKKHE